MAPLLTALIHIQPGSPAAYAFYVLATLTLVTAVVTVAGQARAWVRENDPRRRDDRDEA